MNCPCHESDQPNLRMKKLGLIAIIAILISGCCSDRTVTVTARLIVPVFGKSDFETIGVFVTGDVISPGLYYLKGPASLATATDAIGQTGGLAASGGFEPGGGIAPTKVRVECVVERTNAWYRLKKTNDLRAVILHDGDVLDFPKVWL
jgi:protein involved in polysaccharide export with SLBB domain